MYRCVKVKKIVVVILISICSLIGVIYVGGSAFSEYVQDADEPIFLPAIMYHSICNNEPREYSCTPLQLEKDLNWLRHNGYTAVSAKQLIEYTEGKGELPDKPVLITFDDGFYNNLSLALPLLVKYDMNAIVSCVGSFTDTRAPADPHIDKYSYLTWEDISALTASGRIELGNHTYDMHSVFGERKGCAKISCESDEAYSELLFNDIGLMQSESVINTGCEPTVFAYPFGSICRESIPVLRRLGFHMTLTCSESPNYITRDPKCLYGIGRYNRSGLYSTEEFMERIMLH